MRRLVILGAGGHAREQLDLISALNQVTRRFAVEGFLVDPEHHSGTDTLRGLPILGGVDWLEENAGEVDVVCAIGKPAARRRLASRAQAFGARFPCLVHPTAVLTETAHLGEGVVVGAGAVVSGDVALGDHAHVNIGATISHDCVLEPYATLAPGVHLAGVVRVGEGAEIGVGAAVSDRCTVGAWSILGAGAVAVRDVPADSTAVGVPARVIGTRPGGWHLDVPATGDSSDEG